MNIILENIKKIADNEGITIAKLERVIGASKGVLYRAIANNSDIQVKWLLEIVQKYPQYSCEWLLKSEGLMIKDENTTNFRPAIKDSDDELTCKKLVEAQKDTIDSLKKVVFHLEKEISLHKNNTKM